MKDTFNAATWFLGKAPGIQSEEQSHRAFSNLILKGKLCEAVIFVCAQETEGLQPNELAEDQIGFINKTVALVLAIKHPHKKNTSYAMLETYDETPILFS